MARKKKAKKVLPQIGQAAALHKLVKQAFIAVGVGAFLLIGSLAITFSMSGAQDAQLQVWSLILKHTGQPALLLKGS